MKHFVDIMDYYRLTRWIVFLWWMAGVGYASQDGKPFADQHGNPCPNVQVVAEEIPNWNPVLWRSLNTFASEISGLTSRERRQYLLTFLEEKFPQEWLSWGKRDHSVKQWEHPILYLNTLLEDSDRAVLEEDLNTFRKRLDGEISAFEQKWNTHLKDNRPPSHGEAKKILDELEYFLAWNQVIRSERLSSLELFYAYFFERELVAPYYRGSLLTVPRSENNNGFGLVQCFDLNHGVKKRQGISTKPAFSQDGKWLAIGGKNKKLHLFAFRQGEDIGASWEKVSEFHTGGEVNSSPAFSPDSQWVAVGSNDHKFYIFKLQDDKWERNFAYSTGDHVDSSPAFSPDGKSVVVGSDDGGIYFFLLKDSGKWEKDFAHFTDSWVSSSPAFSPNGQWVAIGCGDQNLYLFSKDSKTWELSDTYPTNASIFGSPAFSPYGDWLAVTDNDYSLHILELWNGKWQKNSEFNQNRLFRSYPVFHPDGRSLLLGIDYFWWRVYSVTEDSESGNQNWSNNGPNNWKMTFEKETLLESHSSPVYSPDGRWISFGNVNGMLQVFTHPEGQHSEKIFEYRTSGNINGRPAFSSNGHWLAAGSQDGYLYVFRTPDFRE